MAARESKTRARGASHSPAFSGQSRRILVLILAVLCSLAADDQPPLRGRPERFSGIVGAVKIQASAAPKEVQAESPLIYKLHLQGPASLEHLPVPDLYTIPGFKERFAVRPVGQDWSARDKTREFSYELRPRNPSVVAIPSFLFVFYLPGSVPPERGYQTRAAPAIPLKVTARPAVSVQDLAIEGLPEGTPPGELRFEFTADLLNESRIPWRPSVDLVIALACLPPLLILARAVHARRMTPRVSAGCAQVRELASKLSVLKLDSPDARSAASQLLDAMTSLQVDGDSHSAHHSRCGCPDFLKLCRAYRYGGADQNQLSALVRRAQELGVRTGGD